MGVQTEFTQALVDAGLWFPTDVPGIYGRSAAFEAIVEGFDARVVEIGRSAGAERIAFPPVVSRELIRRVAYMESFPELCGSIHSFRPDSARHADLVDRVDQGGDWGEYLEQMPLTLCPAACYPVYPTCRGVLPADGRHFDLCSFVFRAEPSEDPARLQSFRMRENVRVGAPDTVRAWRTEWTARAQDLLVELGLPIEVEVASDPFFGRGGKLLAANQIADEAKLELVCPIALEGQGTAIASLNHHSDKFSRAFGIELESGAFAETACVGFGLERVTLALLRTHGIETRRWPADVRGRLGL